jgi:hypothetical protein
VEQPKFPNPQPLFNGPPPETGKLWPLALTWAFVAIPLMWGIYGTLIDALKLFQ